MIDWFVNLHPVFQALLAGIFTWATTSLGAGLVFFFKEVNQLILDAMLGFAAGIMLAATFWSLLDPAFEIAEGHPFTPLFPVVVGFLLGAIFVWLLDDLIPHLHMGFPDEDAEGVPSTLQRSVLLIMAITLHNIPEGLAIGVAFGTLGSDLAVGSMGGAVALMLGLGLHNMPEGAAVSIPLRREGLSRVKCFWYGQLSGWPYLVFSITGAAAVAYVLPLQPYALSFAAGAMIYVVVEELIPEAQLAGNEDVATLGTILGFVVLMILAITLG